MTKEEKNERSALNDLVVVVDDEPNVLEILTFAIEIKGFEVAPAADGVSGLATVRTRRPKFVLLDIMLPGMSGDYVCREIRSDRELDHIFVATMSAMEPSLARAKLRGSGNDTHLTKPFDHEALVQLIEDVFARSSSSLDPPSSYSAAVMPPQN